MRRPQIRRKTASGRSRFSRSEGKKSEQPGAGPAARICVLISPAIHPGRVTGSLPRKAPAAEDFAAVDATHRAPNAVGAYTPGITRNTIDAIRREIPGVDRVGDELDRAAGQGRSSHSGSGYCTSPASLVPMAPQTPYQVRPVRVSACVRSPVSIVSAMNSTVPSAIRPFTPPGW